MRLWPVVFSTRRLSPKNELGQKRKRLSLLDRIKEQGFTQQDLPKAIIFHEFLGIAMLALTWSLCYFFPPSKNKFLEQPIMKMKSMLPAKFSNAVAANGFLSSPVGAAYVESSCLRKIIRPITLPSKVYVTIQFLKLTRSKKTLSAIPTVSSLSCDPQSPQSIPVAPSLQPIQPVQPLQPLMSTTKSLI